MNLFPEGANPDSHRFVELGSIQFIGDLDREVVGLGHDGENGGSGKIAQIAVIIHVKNIALN